jgi:hypothetical protein
VTDHEMAVDGLSQDVVVRVCVFHVVNCIRRPMKCGNAALVQWPRRLDIHVALQGYGACMEVVGCGIGFGIAGIWFVVFAKFVWRPGSSVDEGHGRSMVGCVYWLQRLDSDVLGILQHISARW